MPINMDTIRLISGNFKWSRKRAGFAVESAEAIKAFNMTEIDLLRSLQAEGILKPLGAFGFIVEKEFESRFFSKTELEQARPAIKENKDFAVLASLIEYASRKIAQEALSLFVAADAEKAGRYLQSVADTADGSLGRIIKALPRLQSNQGSKFQVLARGSDAPLDCVAEVVDGQFRLWISWALDEEESSSGLSRADAFKILIGEAVAHNLVGNISFISEK